MNSTQKVYAQKRIAEIAKQKINTAIQEIKANLIKPAEEYRLIRLEKFKNKDFKVKENATEISSAWMEFGMDEQPITFNYQENNRLVTLATAEINREANIVRDTIMLGGETEALSALQSFQDKDFSNLYG